MISHHFYFQLRIADLDKKWAEEHEKAQTLQQDLLRLQAKTQARSRVRGQRSQSPASDVSGNVGQRSPASDVSGT
jgi:hypothetical protein